LIPGDYEAQLETGAVGTAHFEPGGVSFRDFSGSAVDGESAASGPAEGMRIAQEETGLVVVRQGQSRATASTASEMALAPIKIATNRSSRLIPRLY
jgi:hypothetical protein